MQRRLCLSTFRNQRALSSSPSFLRARPSYLDSQLTSSFASSHEVFATKSVRSISLALPVEVEVEKRREAAALGGGAKRIQAQHAKGKLTALERIALLVDEGSWIEECLFMESRTEGEKVKATPPPFSLFSTFLWSKPPNTYN